jgi:hypothetical protein
MKKFVSTSMVLIWCLLGLLSASAAYAQTSALPNDPRMQEFSLLGVGVYGGVDYRPITMDAPNFRSVYAFPTCCPQKYGTQTTLNWLAGVSFDYTLTSWLLLDVRAHLFSAKADFSQQEKILVGVNGAGVETSIRHTMTLTGRDKFGVSRRNAPNNHVTATIGKRIYLQAIQREENERLSII